MLEDKKIFIEIREELFYKLINLMEKRNTSIYNELKNIKPLDNTAVERSDTLQKARDIKTQRVKQKIEETIKELISENKEPTRYQINKISNISYQTINKYYDEILKRLGA